MLLLNPLPPGARAAWLLLHFTLPGGDMTFEELLKSLPNGLHDALLDKVCLDFFAGEVILDARVTVPPGEATQEPVLWQARIRLRGVTALGFELVRAMELGRSSLFWGCSPVINSWAGLPNEAIADSRLIGASQEDPGFCWLCLLEWNPFMYLAARDTSIEWL